MKDAQSTQITGIVLVIAFLSSIAFCQKKVSPRENLQTEGKASATIEGPPMVKAGERATFSITLDQPPNFEGRIYLEFEQNTYPVYSTSVQVLPGAREIKVDAIVPIDAQGTWQLTKLIFAAGSSLRKPLAFSGQVSLEIIPASGLRLPTSAIVTVNLSQAQLLRTEATKVQRQLQDLKALLSTPKSLDVRLILDRQVRNAVDALNSTEESFHKLAQSNTTDTGASKVFFDDLRLSYREAATTLQKSNSDIHPQLIPVSQNRSVQTDYPPAAYAVLRSFEQNELAYRLVSDTQSLVFNLDVQSIPEGATVCYHRKNDPCQPHPNQTNSTIQSLPYAIWIVHFEKTGYTAEDREHDPFREPNHIVVVELKK